MALTTKYFLRVNEDHILSGSCTWPQVTYQQVCLFCIIVLVVWEGMECYRSDIFRNSLYWIDPRCSTTLKAYSVQRSISKEWNGLLRTLMCSLASVLSLLYNWSAIGSCAFWSTRCYPNLRTDCVPCVVVLASKYPLYKLLFYCALRIIHQLFLSTCTFFVSRS